MCVKGAIIGAWLCVGATAFAQDRDFGRSMSFDDSGDSITSYGDFDTKRMTVEAWVKVNFTLTGSAGVASWGRDVDASWEMSVMDRHVDFTINRGKVNERKLRAKGVFEPGAWTHLAASYDGNNARIYVNGREMAHEELQTRIETSSDGTRFVLNAPYPSKRSFNSLQIDEVRVWSIVRTPEQIRCCMQREIEPGTAPLMAYYRFDASADPQIVRDESGNARHATLGQSKDRGMDEPTAVVSTAPFQCLQLVKQAESKVAGVGCSVRLDFEVCGQDAISYLWFKGDELIDGATASRLTVNSISIADQGAYTCIAFGSCGILISDIVRIDACGADFDCNGVANSDDTIVFQTAWASGDPRADVDGSGDVDGADILAFFEMLDTGC